MAARLSLLVCDDDPDILDLLAVLLGSEFDVTTTSSGARAVELALGGAHDAIVLDWMMPQMDGLEVVGALREDARTASVPVVILTARTAAGSEEQCLQAGATAYVRKPFDQQVLSLLIRELVQDQVNAQARRMISDIARASGTEFGVRDW